MNSKKVSRIYEKKLNIFKILENIFNLYFKISLYHIGIYVVTIS